MSEEKQVDRRSKSDAKSLAQLTPVQTEISAATEGRFCINVAALEPEPDEV